MHKTWLIGFLGSIAAASACAGESASSPLVVAQNNSQVVVEESRNPGYPYPNYKPLRFLVGLGLTAGGDTLATVQYSDGGTDKLKAGGDVLFYAGADYRFNDFFSLEGNVGYHLASTRLARNGDATFKRVPVEFLLHYYVSETVRFGAGARFVNSPEVKIDFSNSPYVRQSFSSTVGQVIEAEYLAQPFGLKLRYVNEKYKIDHTPVSIDVSHVGFLASYYF